MVAVLTACGIFERLHQRNFANAHNERSSDVTTRALIRTHIHVHTFVNKSENRLKIHYFERRIKTQRASCSTGGMAIGIDGWFDFVDIDDVTEAMLRVRSGEFAGEFFLLPGHTLKLRDLMTLCAEVGGVRAPYAHLPMWLCKFLASFEPLYAPLTQTFLGRRPMLTRYSMHTVDLWHQFDGRKAAEKLGHKPRPLKDSIRTVLDWHKANKDRT